MTIPEPPPPEPKNKRELRRKKAAKESEKYRAMEDHYNIDFSDEEERSIVKGMGGCIGMAKVLDNQPPIQQLKQIVNSN